MADMAFRVIAAEPGVGVPIHRTVGRDLEGRVALLVEVLAVLGFDGGRIDRVFSEGNSSRHHENHRGTRKPDYTQELVLDIRWKANRRMEQLHAPERGWLGSLRQREHRHCSAKRRVVAQRSVTADSAE